MNSLNSFCVLVLQLGRFPGIVFETGGHSGSGGGSPVSDVAADSADECLIRVYFETAFSSVSGLVDLVVCVRRHGGGGHRLTLAGERFVGRVAEDIAQVGDRGVDFREARRGDGTECVTGDGGRRFVASESVE